jgi:hypothetical protein
LKACIQAFMAEPHLVCPRCHLPILDGQRWIAHEGKTYHADCAPAPGATAERRDDPYPKQFGI